MSADSKYDELNRHLFEEGVKVRREVLGDEYVDQALKNANEWTMPGQELITRFAWGDLWRRPGMDRRTRSLITMGFIIGQKAWLELALHTRGAINNGVTEVEIRELVLQATVYCGTPAGVEAMMVTQRTINDMIAKGEYKRPEPEATDAKEEEPKVGAPSTDATSTA